jgi:hypothetical protein
MSEEVKTKIRNEAGLSASNFQVRMTFLRKKGILVGNRISPKYIPNLT